MCIAKPFLPRKLDPGNRDGRKDPGNDHESRTGDVVPPGLWINRTRTAATAALRAKETISRDRLGRSGQAGDPSLRHTSPFSSIPPPCVKLPRAVTDQFREAGNVKATTCRSSRHRTNGRQYGEALEG